MKLKVIGSSSKGNCYILETEGEALIIECGVRFDQIKAAMHYNLKKVVGCLVTHEHGDHCKSVKDVLSAGIPVYASEGTHSAMNTTTHHRAKVVTGGIKFIGGFQVKAFDVKHDAAEPVGFLIKHPECGTVLFLTDTYYCEYSFSGLNNVIVEANYDQQILDRRLASGASPALVRDRVIESHMSIDTCIELLQANDLTKVNSIVLIHLSDGNSNAEDFKRRIQAGTGKTVHIADAGMAIPFDKTPF